MKGEEVSCGDCDAKCCRYVATEIDAPTCKRDYDNIRWYLLHRGVAVFRDLNGDWFIEFAAPCEKLDRDGACAIYADRPRICREHGVKDGVCEHHSGGSPYALRFDSVGEFETYLDGRGIEWRWKRP